MTFLSFEQNGWKCCSDNLIMVLVCFTGSQLLPTVMKRSEKKRKREQKLITASPSSKNGDSSITKLNCVNTFGKKRLIDKFYEGDDENENVQVPENNNSSDKESDRKVYDFLSSENSCDEWLP